MAVNIDVTLKTQLGPFDQEEAKAWMAQTQRDLQQQSEAWALERKAEFERMFKQEQAELIARSQREQDTM